jgi:hypothetical protein
MNSMRRLLSTTVSGCCTLAAILVTRQRDIRSHMAGWEDERINSRPTLPSTIEREVRMNPFR